MLVSSDDIAAVFGCCTGSVRQWERKGQIPKAKRTPGGQRRWAVEDIAPVIIARGFSVPASWGVKVAA